MSLRKNLEKLVLYWIPAVIATWLISAYVHDYITKLWDDAQNNEVNAGFFVTQFGITNILINHAINNLYYVVVSAWLWTTEKANGTRSAFIWSLFGLFAGLFAVVIYVGLQLYEQNESVDTQCDKEL